MRVKSSILASALLLLGAIILLPTSAVAVTWTQTSQADFLAGQRTSVEALPSGDLSLSSTGPSWAREGVILDVGPSGTPDSAGVRQPFVLQDGGVYHMWYGGFDGSRNRIMHATSADGVAWTRQGVAIPILTPPWNFDGTLGTTVIKEGSTYRMWFSGFYWSSNTGRIYYAESTDAVSWTIQGVALDIGPGSWDGVQSIYGHVVRDPAGLYWVYYQGYDVGPVARIGVATSDTGMTFTKSSLNPVIDLGPNGAFDDTHLFTPALRPLAPWQLWYTGSDGAVGRLGTATTTDGFNLTKSPDNPQFEGGPAGSWDDGGVFGPCFLVQGEETYLYYTGSDGGTYRIGRAREVPGAYSPNGSYESAILDTGATATTFLTLDVNATSPPGTSVSARTRSGDVPTPDASWSLWSAPSGAGVSAISSPAARYLQVGLTLSTVDSTVTPVVHSFTVEYTTTGGNTPPVAAAGEDATGLEGTALAFAGGFTDMDAGDAHVITWDFGDGTGDTGHLAPSHTYLEDSLYTAMLTVCDASNACSSDSLLVTILNVAPVVDAGPDILGSEGTLVDFSLSYSDPGTLDDHDGIIGFGDGTSEAIPPLGPGGGGAVSSSHVYADDGTYLVEVRLCDDEGDCGEDTAWVTVGNVIPRLDLPFDSSAIFEGGTVSFEASATDPGFDFAPAGTTEDFTATVAWDDGTVESVPLVEAPGTAGDPTRISLAAVSHTYGDDGDYGVAVTVCDDDGGCASETLIVHVLNLDPSVLSATATGTAAARLRVAGEKWRDVCIELYEGNATVASGCVTRVPGSPEDQSLDLGSHVFDVTRPLTARVVYTPLDDPVNGQVWGADPAWVIFTRADGTESRIHHTFNARHPDSWAWEPDLLPALASLGITFTATATDPGSDDLTFTWDLGDGTLVTTTYFNDGAGPDPDRSPGGAFPFTATDTVAHTYGAAGTYAVTATIDDDDVGGQIITWILVL